jgi:hypothetical protein
VQPARVLKPGQQDMELEIIQSICCHKRTVQRKLTWLKVI